MPGPLLRDPRLAESARLLWMVSQLEPQRCATGVLERRAGLSRHTVLRGLAQQQCTGLLPPPKGPPAAGDNARPRPGGWCRSKAPTPRATRPAPEAAG